MVALPFIGAVATDPYTYAARSVLTVLVIGILPCLGWFHLALTVETRLEEKQSQLRMAEAFQSRTTMIMNLPTPGWEGLTSVVDAKNRYDTELDRFTSAFYDTDVRYRRHFRLVGSDEFEPWFSEIV